MLNRFVRAVDTISRAGGVLATVLLGVAMVVVCQMIVMRYIFRAATAWQTETVVFSATAALFLGAPYVLLKKGHVGVDVIHMMTHERTRLNMELIGAVLVRSNWPVMGVLTVSH